MLFTPESAPPIFQAGGVGWTPDPSEVRPGCGPGVDQAPESVMVYADTDTKHLPPPEP